jgi:hypothetical protein
MGQKKPSWDDEWLYISPVIAFTIIGLVGGGAYVYKSSGIIFIVICALVGGFLGFLLGHIIGSTLESIFKNEREDEEPEPNYKHTNNSQKNNNSPNDLFDILVPDSYYELLQSRRQDDIETIKRNYRRLLMEFHPDKLGNGASESIQQHAKEMTQKLVKAYEMIELSRNMYKK